MGPLTSRWAMCCSREGLAWQSWGDDALLEGLSLLLEAKVRRQGVALRMI